MKDDDWINICRLAEIKKYHRKWAGATQNIISGFLTIEEAQEWHSIFEKFGTLIMKRMEEIYKNLVQFR